MAKKQKPETDLGFDSMTTPMVAATLTSVIYHARLQNRQAKLNIPDQEVVGDVMNLWRMVRDALGKEG